MTTTTEGVLEHATFFEAFVFKNALQGTSVTVGNAYKTLQTKVITAVDEILFLF